MAEETPEETTEEPNGPSPSDIEQIDESTLGVTWTDGHKSIYHVKLLREKCPCANCIDEWTGEKRIKPGSIPDTIRPINLKTVGLYAIQFDWNDGHSTGLYPYTLLRELCQCEECKTKSAA